MRTDAIRRKFLDYFNKANHSIVKSFSLVPANDPTLYFTNAGMVQFKDVFTGQEKRSYSRATSSQKCLRVSGKHNDLETVGRTSRHHTFFEMLGNFSFGDYFKKEAIDFAWQFLTEDMQLDKEKLVATVFGGDEETTADEEAFELWRKYFDDDKILRLGRADNFWSMGDTGPCGPCTEIHYYQGGPCNESECIGVACECDRWVEVWNLVFMQFNRSSDGVYTPLQKTGVDTGMGLERLAAVVQGVKSTYDIDLFIPILESVARVSNKTYGKDAGFDISMRVIADHARATAFCIADGVFPEKGGREYVLRRIMRRAIRHGKLLGLEELFFHKVCETVIEQMGEAFPELLERKEIIGKIVQAEETAFRRTLDRGLNKLNQAVQNAKRNSEKNLSDEVVGNLYATDGFPIDLTRLIAEEKGLSVDEEASRNWVLKTHGSEDSKVGEEAVSVFYKEVVEKSGTTEFVGYDCDQTESKILALAVSQGGKKSEVRGVQVVKEGQMMDVITEKSPFYGKSGGQVGDTGKIRFDGGWIAVEDTIKPVEGLIVHRGKVKEGELEVGQTVQLEIEDARRQSIRLNHSATHLLHKSLQKVLGSHVAQKGSEVSPNRLRFDFSHFEAVSAEDLVRIEADINKEIRENSKTFIEQMGYDQAKKLGAMALFGEKYGDEVRVVRMGRESIELCGGTHVARTGDIGLCRIVSEEPLALGIRRIVAITGEQAVLHDQKQERSLKLAALVLKTTPDQFVERIEKLQSQVKNLENELSQMKKRLITGADSQGDTLAQVKDVKGVKVLSMRVEAADPKTMREAGDTFRDRFGSGVVVLGGENQSKATFLVMVTKDLTKKVHAGKLVGKLAKFVDGKGGGRPDMAQAGGPKVEGLQKALSSAYGLVEEMLG